MSASGYLDPLVSMMESLVHQYNVKSSFIKGREMVEH